MITGNDLKDFTEVSTRYLPSAMMPFSAFSFTEPDNTRIVRTIKTDECADSYEPETKVGKVGDSFELVEPTPADRSFEFKGWTAPQVEDSDKDDLIIPAGVAVRPVVRVTELVPCFVKKSAVLHEKFKLRIPLGDRLFTLEDMQLSNNPAVFTVLDLSDIIGSSVPEGLPCVISLVSSAFFSGIDDWIPVVSTKWVPEVKINFYLDGHEDTAVLSFNRPYGSLTTKYVKNYSLGTKFADIDVSESSLLKVSCVSYKWEHAEDFSKIVKLAFYPCELVISERD